MDELALPDRYIVFVPNHLSQWHPHFQTLDDLQLDQLYASIMEIFVSEPEHHYATSIVWK